MTARFFNLENFHAEVMPKYICVPGFLVFLLPGGDAYLPPRADQASEASAEAVTWAHDRAMPSSCSHRGCGTRNGLLAGAVRNNPQRSLCSSYMCSINHAV